LENNMLKEMKNLLAFLTIIPVGMDADCLRDAAEYMPLFPLVGAFIGALAGLFAWLLSRILPGLVVGVLTLGFILLVTGLHHTDGLLDFGDGLMCQGPPERKIEVMHDEQTGTGGLMLGLIMALTTAFSIAALSPSMFFQALTVSEVSAKFAMVLVAWAGTSAHEGMGSVFIEAMHRGQRRLRLAGAVIISLGLTIPLLWAVGLLLLAVGVLTCLTIVWASSRHFRGVTGDVFGAANDLARMTSLITVLAVSPWA